MPNDRTLLDKYEGPDHIIEPHMYATALMVQDACNAVAVIHSLGPIRDAVVEEGHARGKSTQWWAEHPLIVLFTTQLAHLVLGVTGDHDQYSRAYQYCKQRQPIARVQPVSDRAELIAVAA